MHVSEPLASQEAAEAEAICEVLRTTMRLERVKEGFGAIFFEGPSSAALSIVNERIGQYLPRVDTDLTHFDQEAEFKDKVTGRPAMLVEVKIVSLGNDKTVLTVTKGFGNEGFVEYIVTMRIVDNRWKVLAVEKGGMA